MFVDQARSAPPRSILAKRWNGRATYSVSMKENWMLPVTATGQALVMLGLFRTWVTTVTSQWLAIARMYLNATIGRDGHSGLHSSASARIRSLLESGVGGICGISWSGSVDWGGLREIRDAIWVDASVKVVDTRQRSTLGRFGWYTESANSQALGAAALARKLGRCLSDRYGHGRLRWCARGPGGWFGLLQM